MRDWRTWRAKNHDIEIKEKLRKDVYRVNGHRGIDYRVNLAEPSCTCPDWQKEEPTGGCKHIRAVSFAVDTGKPSSLEENRYRTKSKNSIDSSAYPDDWERRRRKVYRRDDWTCQNCGARGGTNGNRTLDAHHIVPVAEGGSHDLSNLVTLCRRCHEKVHGDVNDTGRVSSDNRSSATGSSTSTNRKSSDKAKTRSSGKEMWSLFAPEEQLPPWSQSNPYAYYDGEETKSESNSNRRKKSRRSKNSSSSTNSSPSNPSASTKESSAKSRNTTTDNSGEVCDSNEPATDGSSPNDKTITKEATDESVSDNRSLGIVFFSFLAWALLASFCLWMGVEALLHLLSWFPLNQEFRFFAVFLSLLAIELYNK